MAILVSRLVGYTTIFSSHPPNYFTRKLDKSWGTMFAIPTTAWLEFMGNLTA